MKCSKDNKDGKLVTFGIDSENNQKSSYVKFWDPNTTDYQNMKPIKVILVNKVGQPLQNFNCFCVAKDLSALAFGLQDGQILIFKAKSQNLLVMEHKDQIIQTDQEPIKSVHLSKNDQNLNLFCTTDSNIICFQNMQNRKKFSIPAGALFDLTAKGNLIGCPKDDTSTIVEYSDTKKEATWNVDGDIVIIFIFLLFFCYFFSNSIKIMQIQLCKLFFSITIKSKLDFTNQIIQQCQSLQDKIKNKQINLFNQQYLIFQIITLLIIRNSKKFKDLFLLEIIYMQQHKIIKVKEIFQD